MKNYKRNFYFLLALAIMASASLCYYAYNQHEQIETLIIQKIALTDTLTLYKTKTGKNGAYIPVYKGSKKDVLAILKKTDPKLYEVAKSASGLSSISNLKTVFKVDTVVKIDTIFIPTKDDPNGKLFIEKTINNEYYNAKVTIKDDSLTLGLRNSVSIDFMTRNKSNGFLKPKTYITDVIINNPYTDVVGLKSFEITPKSHKGLKITIVAGALIGAYLVLK